jgi:hypothetical protein
VTGSRSRRPEANPGAGSNPETLSVITDDSSPTYGALYQRTPTYRAAVCLDLVGGRGFEPRASRSRNLGGLVH